MSPEGQAQFVNELIDNIRDDVLLLIRDKRIPEVWDGIELRQYLAIRFVREKYERLMRGKRGREFGNTVIINNL